MSRTRRCRGSRARAARSSRALYSSSSQRRCSVLSGSLSCTGSATRDRSFPTLLRSSPHRLTSPGGAGGAGRQLRRCGPGPGRSRGGGSATPPGPSTPAGAAGTWVGSPHRGTPDPSPLRGSPSTCLGVPGPPRLGRVLADAVGGLADAGLVIRGLGMGTAAGGWATGAGGCAGGWHPRGRSGWDRGVWDTTWGQDGGGTTGLGGGKGAVGGTGSTWPPPMGSGTVEPQSTLQGLQGTWGGHGGYRGPLLGWLMGRDRGERTKR